MVQGSTFAQPLRGLRGMAVVLLCGAALTGCSKKITLGTASTPREVFRNWTAFGGDLARTNYRERTVRPPLYNIWTYKTSSAAGTTLISANGSLYFATLDGRLDALDVVTGERLGRVKLPDNTESTCTYHEGHLYIALRYGEKTLSKYHIASGDYIWKIDAGDIASEPLVTDDAIFVSALYRHIDRYDPATGQKVWSFTTEDQHRSSPALWGNTLVVGCDNGTIYALDAETGKLTWQLETGGAVFATPVITNGHVYAGSVDSLFYAVDVLTGRPTWQFKTESPIFQSAASNHTYVTVGGTDGQVYCFDAVSGKLAWFYDAPSPISTPPLITGEVVYFGTLAKKFYALELETGRELWSFTTAGRIRTAPILWDDYVMVASEDKFVYAFSPKQPAAAREGTNP